MNELNGKRLKEIRKLRVGTLEQVEQITGILKQNLSKIENGKRDIRNASADLVYRLAKAYRTTMEDIIMETTKRWAIYHEHAEVDGKTAISNAIDAALEDSSNDVTRKVVATLYTLEGARDYLAKHFSHLNGYGNKRYDIEMFVAYEQEYDEQDDEWLDTGNMEVAKIDPAQVD